MSLSSSYHFWRHVFGCANHIFNGGLIRSVESCEAKVSELDPIFLAHWLSVEHDILKLDVPMANAHLMEV